MIIPKIASIAILAFFIPWGIWGFTMWRGMNDKIWMQITMCVFSVEMFCAIIGLCIFLWTL
jgi:hypothetical protein